MLATEIPIPNIANKYDRFRNNLMILILTVLFRFFQVIDGPAEVFRPHNRQIPQLVRCQHEGFETLVHPLVDRIGEYPTAAGNEVEEVL